MNLNRSSLYRQDIEIVSNLNLPWEKLYKKTILVSGATGQIGRFLIDVLMYQNINGINSINIVALGRNINKAHIHYDSYFDNQLFRFIEHDINNPLIDFPNSDYIVHAASNTHPLQYANDPIGTISTNVIGTDNLLKYAILCKVEKFVFLSSVEIYGENRGDVELFSEDYCGYLDCNTLRAGYPESKRAGESLCCAYYKKYGLEYVIPRLCRVYGPSMNQNDSKVIAQFIRKAISGEDIILKSSGKQLFSFAYISDAVAAILFILLLGKGGEAYNVADSKSNISLKDLAKLASDLTNTQVIFQLPDNIESSGYSSATKALLLSDKLKALGWYAEKDIYSGLKRTIDILKSINCIGNNINNE